MRILLIDDSEMQQKIARIYLEKGGGFTVETAKNGEEGIEKIMIQTPDLILLDMEMPVMDGEQTLIKLKSHDFSRDIPVIMCTGNSDMSLQDKFLKLGAIAYIKKPHGYSNLKAIIEGVSKVN